MTAEALHTLNAKRTAHQTRRTTTAHGPARRGASNNGFARAFTTQRRAA